MSMDYTITYYSEAVEDDVLALPARLLARELRIAEARLKESKNTNP